MRAAQELPLAKAGLDEIVARAEADAAVQARLVADLEAAARGRGLRARPGGRRSAEGSLQVQVALRGQSPHGLARTCACGSSSTEIAAEGRTPGGGSAAALVTAIAAGSCAKVAQGARRLVAGSGRGRRAGRSACATAAPLAQADARAVRGRATRPARTSGEAGRAPGLRPRPGVCHARPSRRCRSLGPRPTSPSWRSSVARNGDPALHADAVTAALLAAAAAARRRSWWRCNLTASAETIRGSSRRRRLAEKPPAPQKRRGRCGSRSGDANRRPRA